MRRASGLVAALLILLAGIASLRGPALPFGIVLTTLGIAGVVWQIRLLRASRVDPYDLKLLYAPDTTGDTDDQPEVDYLEEDGVPYCHHCGHAVSQPYSRCPECGNAVR